MNSNKVGNNCMNLRERELASRKILFNQWDNTSFLKLTPSWKKAQNLASAIIPVNTIKTGVKTVVQIRIRMIISVRFPRIRANTIKQC